MFKCTSFSYDGRYSDEYRLKVVSARRGLEEVPYATSRNAVYDKVTYNPYAFYHGVDSSIFEFTLHLACDRPWTERQRRDVARWLFKPTYKPFISADNPDLVYNCICVGDPSIVLGMSATGYIILNFICDSAFPTTKNMIQDLDFRFNTDLINPYTFKINNISNEDSYQPSFRIELYIPHYDLTDYPYGDAPNVPQDELSFSLRNLRNTRPDKDTHENSFIISSKKFPNAPLRFGETIAIDMWDESVLSDEYKYRLRNTNRKWISLDYGINEIEVKGACVLRIYNKYAILR